MKYLRKTVQFIFSVIILLVASFFLSSNTLINNVQAASVSWDGGGDAVSWSDPLNWSGDAVPTDADDVLIDADVTVNLSAGTTVNSLVLGNSGGTTSPIFKFTYDAVGTTDPLVIDSGDLEIYSGAKVTHTAGTSVVVGSVNIDIQTGDLIVYSGGTIDVSEKGYAAGQGPGGSGGTGGPGYGGEGGDSSSGSAGGPSYGSMTNPLDLGTGGRNGALATAGKGGGLVKLDIANNLTLNGSITANGGNASTINASYYGTGGTGGSINIDIGNVWGGSGSISAAGGNSANSNTSGGGGAGGRISIYGYSSKTFSGTILANGGNGGSIFTAVIGKDGGAGSIYLQASGAFADLIINNLGTNDANSGGITPIDSSSTFSSIEISNYAYPDFIQSTITSDITIDSNSYFSLDTNLSTDNMAISDSSTVIFNSTAAISSTLEVNSSVAYISNTANVSYSTFNFISSDLIDNGGDFPAVSGSVLNIPDGCTVHGNYPRSYTSGSIAGTLTHTANTTTLENKIEYSFSGDLTIASTGKIDISQKGYSPGNGTSAGQTAPSYNGAGGGAHGGDGGDGDTGYLGGTAYDTSNNPQDAGSGGGNSGSHLGGAGGGLVILDIGGTLDLQGPILANGGDGVHPAPYSTGGGAGGGVNIQTNIFAGDSDIQAFGGTAQDSYGYAFGGGGGGGLIFVEYGESTFTGSVDVSGGTGFESGSVGIATVQSSNQSPQASETDLSSTANLYAGHSYSIDSVYSDADGQDDLSQLYFLIQNPDGDDVEIRADYSATDLTDQIPDLLSGSSYVDNVNYSIYPTYGTANEVKVTWTFDVGWNWSESSTIEYGVKASDSMGATSSYSMTSNSYLYKNTLEFNSGGALVVTDELGDPISTESWMLPDATVNWTGYKVVYTGETDVYPNVDDYNVKLEDGTTRFWLDSGTYGENFDITTDTLSDTTVENIYTLSIVDIPTGGSSSDSKTFTIKVDADDPTITTLDSSSHPTEASWYSTNILNILWEVLDDDSGVDEVYRYISENPDETESSVESNGTLTALTEWTSNALSNGIYYFYLLVKDLVGNSTVENRTVKVDSSVPDIVDITGEYENEWQNVDSGPTISWTDPLSLSDDTFYITTDGTIPSVSNFRYATNQSSYNLPSLGEGEFNVKVRARNNASTYSTARTFVIKYDSTATDPVGSITANVGSTNKVTLTWSNPDDSDFSKTLVLRKAGSVPSGVKDGTKVYEGSSESYTSSTLASSTKYYFAFWAYDEVGNVSDRSSASVTTLDLNPTASVTEFEGSSDVEGRFVLTWKNPLDSDFSKVKLYRGEDLLYEGNLETYTDTLTIEGDYQYKIYAYDSSNNRSDAKTLNYEFTLEEEDEDVVLVKEDSSTESVSEGSKSKVVLGEDVEIQIPVSKLLGDVDPEEADKVVLTVNDVEYEMQLSEDKKFFTTKFTAPDTKGDHKVSAVASKKGQILGQLDVDIEVVDVEQYDGESVDGSIDYTWWVVGGVLLLICSIGVLFAVRNKKTY